MSSLLSILYKHYSLRLKKEELSSFLNFLQQFKITSCLEKDFKGRLNLTFWKEKNSTLTFCMEEEDGYYLIHQTFELKDLVLESVIRESIPTFCVTTVAEHRYGDNTVIYDYQNGVIDKVTEKNATTEKVIYQFPKISSSNNTEYFSKSKIEKIKNEINHLLDKRNNKESFQEKIEIDRQLKILTAKIKNQKISD